MVWAVPLAALQGHGVGEGQGHGQPGYCGFSLTFGKEVVGTMPVGRSCLPKQVPRRGHRKKVLSGARAPMISSLPKSRGRHAVNWAPGPELCPGPEQPC